MIRSTSNSRPISTGCSRFASGTCFNAFDGTYLHCEKRLSDAEPSDTIRFDEKRRPHLDPYLIRVEPPTEIIAEPGQTLLLLGAAGRRMRTDNFQTDGSMGSY